MTALRSCFRAAANIQRLSSLTYIGQRGFRRWISPTIKEIVRRKKAMGPEPVPVRSNFLEWNYDAEIYAFNKRLSESFDTQLLMRAMTHRSYIIQEEQKQREVGIEDPKLDIEDNRELIEEGKVLTSKIVKSYLRHALPLMPEECIIALHGYLLSENVLAQVATQLGTKDLILTAEHPTSTETRANTFLALVAALTRSVNVTHAGVFVRDFLLNLLVEKDIAEIWYPAEPMEVLNNILLREKREPAEPRVIAEAGVNTLLAVYQIAVYSNKQFLGSGFGETIEIAKEMAALNTLFRMFNYSQPIKFNMIVDIDSENQIHNLPLTQWCNDNIKKVAHA